MRRAALGPRRRGASTTGPGATYRRGELAHPWAEMACRNLKGVCPSTGSVRAFGEPPLINTGPLGNEVFEGLEGEPRGRGMAGSGSRGHSVGAVRFPCAPCAVL